MTPKIRAVICAVVSAAVLLVLLPAQAQSPQATLNQYLFDLQKNQNDYALREKIIKHVQTMRPAPAIPEEARRYFIEGNALLKAAKAQKGYELAIDAYRQCLLIAPWWAEAYFNYAVALDLANRFDEAVNVLKLYIATNPGGEESRKAQDKIYEIGAKKKLAAQEREESSPQAVAAREQKKSEDWLKKLDGARFVTNEMEVGDQRGYFTIDIRGNEAVFGTVWTARWGMSRVPIGVWQENQSIPHYTIKGREFSMPADPARFTPGSVAKIDEDGRMITVTHDNGVVTVYRRQH